MSTSKKYDLNVWNPLSCNLSTAIIGQLSTRKDLFTQYTSLYPDYDLFATQMPGILKHIDHLVGSSERTATVSSKNTVNEWEQ